MMKRIPRLALLGLGFVVMLAVTFAMVPPESAQSDVVTPRESTPLPRFFNHPELVVIDIKPWRFPNFSGMKTCASL